MRTPIANNSVEPSPTQGHRGPAQPLTPKIATLRDALRKMDATSPYGVGSTAVRAELLRAAQAAGFDPRRAVDDWARYTVAVAEAVTEEPEEDVEQTAFEFSDGSASDRVTADPELERDGSGTNNTPPETTP